MYSLFKLKGHVSILKYFKQICIHMYIKRDKKDKQYNSRSTYDILHVRSRSHTNTRREYEQRTKIHPIINKNKERKKKKRDMFGEIKM